VEARHFLCKALRPHPTWTETRVRFLAHHVDIPYSHSCTPHVDKQFKLTITSQVAVLCGDNMEARGNPTYPTYPTNPANSANPTNPTTFGFFALLLLTFVTLLTPVTLATVRNLLTLLTLLTLLILLTLLTLTTLATLATLPNLLILLTVLVCVLYPGRGEPSPHVTSIRSPDYNAEIRRGVGRRDRPHALHWTKVFLPLSL
jgi:hypothetical protein